jgi:hypothetical protein
MFDDAKYRFLRCASTLSTEQQEVTNLTFLILTLAAAIISLLHDEKKMADVECLRILPDAGSEQFSGLLCHF